MTDRRADIVELRARVTALEDELAGLPYAMTAAVDADDEAGYATLTNREPFLRQRLVEARGALYVVELEQLRAEERAVAARRAEAMAELSEYRSARQVYEHAERQAAETARNVAATLEGQWSLVREREAELAQVRGSR